MPPNTTLQGPPSSEEVRYYTKTSSNEGSLLQVGTDLSRWRLKVARGRHVWHYLPNDESAQSWPQSIIDKFHLGTLKNDDLVAHAKELNLSKKATSSFETVEKGLNFFKLLQTEDGHWAGEYGGPMFLLPGLIISLYATESLHCISPEQKAEIIKYLFGKQNESEGGWGLHTAGKSTMFGTSLNYCVLRILGVDKDHSNMVRARAFIQKNGGSVGVPQWGKFWLAILNVYSWEGIHPIPPELWIMPDWVTFHPGRYWCHCRQVYLPMSYCYGYRFAAKESPLILSLREELHTEPFESIDWYYCRSKVCDLDMYSPHTAMLEGLYVCLHYYEQYHIGYFRKKSLDHCKDLVKAEDMNTKCIGIGPVSKVMNAIVAYHSEGKQSDWFQGHIERVKDYLWISSKGMMMTGTNGSQLWDTAFAVQAIIETGLHLKPENYQCVTKALEFFDVTQIDKNVDNHDSVYRHISAGAFPFSTYDCGWIVSDCTAEALKAIMYLQNNPIFPKLIADERIFDGINVLLSMQNPDGGFGTYEKQRSTPLLELINPAEVFANIMVEYSYIECTSAVIQGLSSFKKFYPNHRNKEIESVIEQGISYITKQQRKDGSYYGCWGVCFTYAAWFANEALALKSLTYSNSNVQKRSCDYLVSKQKVDGGWGETFASCDTCEYTESEVSQAVQTSWALMALMAARYPDRDVIDRGIKCLISQQDLKGHWEMQGITGVFNKSCAIDYPNYQNIFPLWCLGRYNTMYGNKDFE